MTTDIQRFEFPVTGQAVRATEVNGEPYFVAADVAAVLGYGGGARNAVARLPERMKGVEGINTPGGQQNMTVLTEAGVYRLVMRSNLPAAEAFQDWLAEKVIPAIRRTGSYVVAQTAEERMAIGLQAAQELLELKDKQIAELAPAADHWHTLAAADGDYSVADAAKILSRDPLIKIGRDRLFTVLDQQDWIYRQQADGKWRTYQRAINAGRLSEIPQSHYHPRTGELVLDPPQVRVTPKGIADLRVLLGGTVPLSIEQKAA